MSDDLTLTQLTELQRLLSEVQRETERSLATSKADAKPVDLELSIGRLSRVDALQQQYMAMARQQRVELTLVQIRAALARIKNGTYGACVKCDEQIGYARLRARPESSICFDCQSGGGD